MKRHIVSIVLLSVFCAACSAPPQRRDAVTTIVLPNGPDVEANVVGAADQPPVSDPLMRINRGVFGFNDFSYRYVLIPVASGYDRVAPESVKRGVANFFYNLKMPVRAVNHLLQGKAAAAGTNVLRFGVNSTVGILGLFDPAADWWDIQPLEALTRDTLTQYHVRSGSFVVLPLLGPTDLRGSAGLAMDYLLNPLSWLLSAPEDIIVPAADFTQQYSGRADNYLKLRKNVDDPYLFFRNLYLQGRQRDSDYPLPRH